MATKKKTAKKKTAKRAGGRPKAGEPTKADFIREKLKAGMSASEVVKAGAEKGMKISPPQVYKLKAKMSGTKPTATKAEPAPAEGPGRRGGASEWVRQQLAAGKTPAEVWEEAQKSGVKFSRNLIYTVKSAGGSSKGKPGRKPKSSKALVSPSGAAVEEQFKQFIGKIGVQRAMELVEQAASWGRAFGVEV